MTALAEFRIVQIYDRVITAESEEAARQIAAALDHSGFEPFVDNTTWVVVPLAEPISVEKVEELLKAVTK